MGYSGPGEIPYYKGANGIIIVYDVTEQRSFDHVKQWLADIDKHASSNVHKLLIGNKGDLSGERVVDYATAKQYAESVNMPFIETSAKCADNVEQAFVMVVSKMKSNFDETHIPSNPQDTVHPGSEAGAVKPRCC